MSVQETYTLRKTVLEVGFAVVDRAIQRFPKHRLRKRIPNETNDGSPSFGCIGWLYGCRIRRCEPETVIPPQGRVMYHLLPPLRHLYAYKLKKKNITHKARG
jgi:hypothetical protein